MISRLIAISIAAATSGTVLAQTDTPPPRDPAAMFAKADANKDKAIVLTEWLAIGRREMGFKLMDADRDGKVTQPEFTAGLEKFRAYAKPR
jgi:hypothetical protein